ncbi:polycystic kidney disease and receptor for egg jelly-related protein, partial [Elysia marginata]
MYVALVATKHQILHESEGANVTKQTGTIDSCNSQPQCDMWFRPPETGFYFIRVVATKEASTLEQELKVLVAVPLPPGGFVFSSRNPIRSQSNSFYINDVVTVDYQATLVPTIVPDLTSCSVDWGDGTVLVEEAAVLTVNETVVVYSANHSYANVSQYEIMARCNTSVFEVSTPLTARVQHPAIDASVSLVDDQVVADPSGTAHAVINISHLYLNSSYTALLQASIDFGDGSGVSSLPISLPNSVHSRTYQKRGHYVITVSLVYLTMPWTPTTLNFYAGYIDIYEVQRRTSVFIGEEITFQIININSQEIVNFNYDLGISNGSDVFSLHQVINITVTYAETMEVIATAEASASGDKAVYLLAVTSPGCLSSIFLFEQSYRALASPIMVFLSDLPSVTGQIQTTADCNSSLDFSFRWELWRSSGMAAGKHQWNEVVVEQQNSFRFQLSQAISDTGMYNLMLTVGMTDDNVTDSIYIQVDLPPLVARIAGGNTRQVSHSHFLSLDAETESYDPAALDSSGLQFSWACYVIKDDGLLKYASPLNTDLSYRSFSPCFIPLSSQGKLGLQLASFSVGDEILFEVTVSKDSRQAIAAVGLEIVAADIPVVLMNCRWNCGPRLVAEERLTLVPHINCPQCSEEELLNTIYTWTILKLDTKTDTYVPQPWNSDVYSSSSSSLFDSRGGWWEEGATYSMYVEITVGSRPKAAVSRSVYVNYKPYNGACSAKPVEGIEAVTSFIFSASGWKDEGNNLVRQPNVDKADTLSYQIYQTQGGSRGLVHSGAAPTFPAMLMPACDSPDDYCNIDVDIRDRHGSTAVCTVRVKVSRPAANVSKATIDDMLKAMNSPLRVAQAMQDPIRVAHTASVLSKSLENMESSLPTDTLNVTGYSVENLQSGDGLVRLIDPTTVSDPTRDAMIQVQDQYVSSVSWAVSTSQNKGISDDLKQILPLADALVTVTESPQLLSGQALVIASQAGSVLTTFLDDATSVEIVAGDMNECLIAITKSVGNVANALAVDVLAGRPSTRQDEHATDLSQRELEYISDLQARRERFQSKSKFENAETIVSNIEETVTKAFKVARLMELYDGTFSITTEKASIAVKGTSRADLIKGNNRNDPVTALGFSVADVHTGDMRERLHVQVVKTENMYIHGSNSHFITSQVVTGSVVTSDGRQKMLVTPSVVHSTGLNCSEDEQLVKITPSFIEDDASQFYYHSFEHQDINSAVCIRLRPTVSNLFYRLYAKAGSPPTDLSYDYRCHKIITLSYQSLKIVFHVIREVDDQVKCVCQDTDKLTSALAFHMLPNRIDFTTVFSQFDVSGQAAVLGTILGIVAIFSLVSLWAHYRDRKSLVQ